MKIKHVDDGMLMTQTLRCVNDMGLCHIKPTFEKVDGNEYKCTHCGAVLIVKEPVLNHDDNGRLKMEVHVKQKR